MKEIRKYCVGKQSHLGVIILVILFFSLIIVLAVYQGAPLAKIITMLKYLIKIIVPLLIPFVVIDLIIKYIVGDLNSRFRRSMKKINDRNMLEQVKDDFKNGVLFFKNGNVKIGQYCLFLKEEGWIFFYDEISSVRINIVQVRNQYGNGFDAYVPQICVGGKYHKLDELKNDLNDLEWRQFAGIIQSQAPHIIFENTPYVTTLHRDDKLPKKETYDE